MEKSSGWTSREAFIRKKKNKSEIVTGLSVTGKELVQIKNRPDKPLIWTTVSFVWLFLCMEGLTASFVSGFSIPCNGIILYFGVVLASAVATLFFYGERLNGYRLYGILGLIVVYGIILFLTQDLFLNGARGAINTVIRQMNMRYDSEVRMFSVGTDAYAVTVFLVEILFFMTFVLAVSIVYRPDILPVMLILFPLMAVLVLFGGEPSVFSLFLLMFGVLGIWVSTLSVRKKRLWGEPSSSRFAKNLDCHERVQKTSALWLCAVSLLLAVPGFYAVRPVLSVQLAKAETVSATVEGKVMEKLISVLPKISAGQLNLKAETVSGGVNGGMLGDVDGYAMSEIEDLKLTSSRKPTETIYLKGYIGSIYTGNRWDAPDEDNFKSAASMWHTEDDPALYIQNLPFLRKMYTENQAENSGTQMADLSVERINAGSRYTYVPYNAYLNEYYEVENGDGCVQGQAIQEDIFSYFPEDVYSEAMELWNADEDNKSVLDRVEASYNAFVHQYYLEVPDNLKELEEECKAQKLEESDIEKIEDYIALKLNETCTYNIKAEQLPEGEDFIYYFLYKSKEGYSTHFASAATVMFRMFGIPARYVVGYAAPANLFKSQTDGSYTAVLQADHAHAWTEIYVSGEGWRPVETTPGGFGTAEEVEYRGKKVTDSGNPREEAGTESDEERKNAGKEKDFVLKLPLWLDGSLQSVVTVLELVIALTAMIFLSFRVYRKHCRVTGHIRKQTAAQKIAGIFIEFYSLFLYTGMSDAVESTDNQFILEVQRRCPDMSIKELQRMQSLVLQSHFGYYEMTEADVQFMSGMYKRARKACYRKMPLAKKIKIWI